MKKFTEAQQKKLDELLRAKEAAEAEQAAFLKECRKQKSTVLKELDAVPAEELKKAESEKAELVKKLQNVEERIEAVCQKYHCTVDELFDHISSDRQANYYFNSHRNNTF